jgi:hypothetical protein
MSWLATLLLRGARALVVAITMLPALLVVILSAPAWVVWPWLGEERRESVHRMVDQLTQWTRDVLYQTMPLSDADHRQIGALTPGDTDEYQARRTLARNVHRLGGVHDKHSDQQARHPAADERDPT